MKRLAILLLLVIITTAPFAKTNPSTTKSNGTFGLGVIVGEPTGLTAKAWLDNIHAVDFGLAWSLNEKQSFHLRVDYLWHFRDVFPDKNATLYVGVGGRLRVIENQDTKLGVTIPLGFNYEIPRSPVELFVEAVPIVDLTPSSEFDMNGGVGVRFYFGR